MFLTHHRGWTLAALEDRLDMHKNSTMRIKDLRITYAVRRKLIDDGTPYKEGDKTRLVEVEQGAIGDDGKPAIPQWLWNPQIDTFERLERLLKIAEAEGFDSRRSIQPRPWQKLRGGKRAKTNGPDETPQDGPQVNSTPEEAEPAHSDHAPVEPPPDLAH